MRTKSVSLAARVLLAGITVTGCVAEATDDGASGSDDALTGFSAQQITVSMKYGETAVLSNLENKSIAGVKFTGAAGDQIEAWLSVDAWLLEPHTAALIGPNGKTQLAANDPAVTYTADGRIRFTLTSSGTHYLAFKKKASSGDGAWVHLEKKGGARAALVASTSTDPCVSQPWPMAGNCRDTAYRSASKGPLSGHVAWTAPFAWTGYDAVGGIAVGRDGTLHVLHGPWGVVLGYTALVYSAFGANGQKILSERMDLGRVYRASMALAADGTPYVLVPDGVTGGPQQGQFRGSLFRLDVHGVATEAGAFDPPAALLLDDHDEIARYYPQPLLRIDDKGRPYVRVRKEQQPNSSLRYLGDVDRLDPATNAVSYVTGASSNEPAGIDYTEYTLAGGGVVKHGAIGIERRNATGQLVWSIYNHDIAGLDVAHDHLLTRTKVNAPSPFIAAPPWVRFDIYSLTTGKLLWSTAPRGFAPRDPLVHANGDIVFQAGKDSFDGSFEVYGVNGAAKASVSLADPPLDVSNTEFALDAANTTYAFQGKRFFAVDESGAKRIDLTLPVTDSARAHIVVGANATVYVVTTHEIVAIQP